MHSLKLVFVAVAALLLAVSVGYGDIYWTFNITPQDGEALPGGTVQFYYDVTNLDSSTEALTSKYTAKVTSAVPFSSMPDFVSSGWDISWRDIDGLMPGQSITHKPFFHFMWDTTATMGWSTSGNMSLQLDNGNVSPREPISYPYTAAVTTPELPPGALGLLSFIPYGIWRLRMRKR